MTLLPLVPSASFGTPSEIGPSHPADAGTADKNCGFCGGAVGEHAFPNPKTADSLACALCYLVLQLERSRIDEEAELIWLPEMGQAAIMCVVREIHRQLRSLGEALHAEAVPSLDTADRRRLYVAFRSLRSRADVASSRLGSTRPSELARALIRMSAAGYRGRGLLLSGIRLLPSGRFFEGDRDVYPEIVDSWLRRRRPVAGSGIGAVH